MSCSAARITSDSALQDAGYARPGVIILNWHRLRELTAEAQRLIFLHECAHQHVGFGNSEQAADCWAIRRGKAEGWLDAAAMDRICQSVRTWPGSPVHLAGPARCEAMRRCFAGDRASR
jgi:hypothetical protein